MAKGLIGGVLVGGLVSTAGLGAASLLAPLPAGVSPMTTPMAESAGMEDQVEPVPASTDALAESAMSEADLTPEDMAPEDAAAAGETAEQGTELAAADTAPQNGTETDTNPSDMAQSDAGAQPADVSSPVGSLEIVAPQTPDIPENDQALAAVETEVDGQADPVAEIPDVDTPRADTDPLDEPVVASIEGSMAAPDVPQGADLQAQPVEPVFPNPQSLPPETPESESDLMVSTNSAQPPLAADPQEGGTIIVVDEGGPAPDGAPAQEPSLQEESFVVDLTAPIVPPEADSGIDQNTATGPSDSAALPEVDGQDNTSDVVASAQPRVQLQGSQNALLDGERETGVTVNRLVTTSDTPDDASPDTMAPPTDALGLFAAEAGDIDGKALMSIVLIDDGSMSGASAALSGLPFPVTIALDPSMPNAAELMTSYRAEGFEVAVMAMLPDGALPSDVEVTFESVFRSLPETVAILDIGTSGLQSDRDVTQQAMSILAEQGRGYVTVAQGLNTAGRAAEAAGVPNVEVFRDLDSDGQDARVIRRFVDNAAFRARQESGVVLIGRVRADTISALILWGATAQDELTAVVPVSAVLRSQ